MMSNLTKFRNASKNLIDELCLDVRPPTKELVDAIFDNHPDLINKCDLQLRRYGVTQIVNDILRKQRDTGGQQGQLPLPGMPKYIKVPRKVDGHLQYDNQPFRKSKISEVREWILREVTAPRAQRMTKEIALLDDIAQYVDSEDATVDEALIARKESEDSADRAANDSSA